MNPGKMSVYNTCVCLIQICLHCRVYIRIFTVLFCSSLTIGQFEGNKYMKAEVISLISNIGPTMCTNKCKSLYGCNGVNFDRQQLTCELLRIKQTTDMTNDISEKAGSMFATMSSLQPKCASGAENWYRLCSYYHWVDASDGGLIVQEGITSPVASTSALINADACWPNPCSQNNKCIVSRQYKAFCITTVSELLFMKTITSTNYPGEYPNNDKQSWTLAVERNLRLVLKFKAFDLETDSDILKIYDRQYGTELYSLTGHNLPDNIWSNETIFFITFTSDFSVTSSGFSIDVYKTA